MIGSFLPILTLLSDFGTRDAFVGIMKGVALSVDQGLQLVDLTHDIPPQAVTIGALALRSAVPWFPPGTVHLAVVDPGVGTDRAAIAVQTDQAILVGPDNGLLAPAAAALGGVHAVHTIEPAAGQALSRTFHGRDLFAPAAARLATGAALAALGPARDEMVDLALPLPLADAAGVSGAVVYVDRFGNLLTNIDRDALLAFRHHSLSVRVAEMPVPLRATYADVASGEPVALWSSWDTIEVAVRDGNAALQLGLGVGAAVTVVRH